MGLDMYAYVATKAGAHDEFYQADGEFIDGEWRVADKTKPREIAYWRKHPNLHGWMEQLWIRKLAADGKTVEAPARGSSFNGIELELTWEDLEALEQDILEGTMSQLNTKGFFFGDPSDDYYKEADLKFIRNAKAELVLGLKVFYNSSW